MLVTGDFSERLVGAERDADEIVDVALAGTSVLVAGPLGSGKSHLLRAVAQKLKDAGTPTVVLHPSRALARVPFGAIKGWPDDPASLLAGDHLHTKAALLLVIDDVQDLDASSADLVAQAICRRRAVAVAGIETPRGRTTTAPYRSSSSEVLVDLWLRGFADRIDLREMTTSDAEELLSLFPGADDLDTSTRAAVIGLAEGSRMLLRELAAHATSALRSGREPFAALGDVQRHTRLGDAVAAHVAELDDQDRAALALLGHVRGIEYADATRLVASSAVTSLLSAGLVHQDGTRRRTLTPNAVLAHEADEQLAPHAIETLVNDAGSRMLSPGAGWWSEPVAAALARCWHESARAPECVASAAPEVRLRVARAGAQQANDSGDIALAAAFSRLPTGAVDEPSLRVERAHADELLGRPSSKDTTVDLDALDDASLRRYLRLRHHTVDRREVSEMKRLARRRTFDGETRCEIDLMLAADAALNLDWRAAETCAAQALGRETGSGSTRLRAQLLIATCRTELGAWGSATSALRGVDSMLSDPQSARELDAGDRVLAVCTQLALAQSAGLTPRHARRHLIHAAVEAVQMCSPLAVVLAGLASALMYAGAGGGDRAITELNAALRRARGLQLGMYGDMVQLSIARSAALLGRPEDARRILDRVSGCYGDPSPLLEHAVALTESCVLAGESRFDEAVVPALAASRISSAAGLGAPLRRLRDLHQLAALGVSDDLIVDTAQAIAADTHMPATTLLADSIRAIVGGRRGSTRRSPLDLLRASALWCSEQPPGTFHEGSRPHRPPRQEPVAGSAPPFGLTRREEEIARLIAVGLGNREIAERLFLSVRTVESHVYQAKAKVGATSRADLGRVIGG